MPREYCQRCAAEVPVDDGVCFFGHEVDPAATAPGLPGEPADDRDADAPPDADPGDRPGVDDGDDTDLFAARPVDPGEPSPAVDADEPLIVAPAADEPPATDEPPGVEADGAAAADPDEPADDVGPLDASEPALTGDVDVGALESAIAELESREDGDERRADGDETEPGAVVASDEDRTGEPDLVEEQPREAPGPPDEAAIDDLVASGDFEDGLTWEGEVEDEQQPGEPAPAVAADAGDTDEEEADATREDDGRDVLADWEIDDWSGEAARPAAVEPVAAEPAAAGAPEEHVSHLDDDLTALDRRFADLDDRTDEPVESTADEGRALPETPASAEDDERAPDGDRPAIDPTSFTARRRRREGLLSRLFG